jgi:hypothetical protein
VTKEQRFIKEKCLQGSPLNYQAKDGSSTTTQRKYKKRLKFYATSVAGSMAGEGVEGSAAAALGGGVKELGVEVEEVTEGVMSDTMLGAYFFAYLKKPSISERGWAGEDPILALSTSLPCDWARAIAPSTPCFTDVRFKVSTGSSTVSKASKKEKKDLLIKTILPNSLRVFPSKSFLRLSPGISPLFFGQNLTNMQMSTCRVSQRTSCTSFQWDSSKSTDTINGSLAFGYHSFQDSQTFSATPPRNK